jgi:hypothetical protein
MPDLPDHVAQAWDEREGPIILTTVNDEGIPNSIYAASVTRFDDETLVVADNYFDKTRANILANGRGAILFITGEGTAFQVKGTIEYHEEGPIFEDMKCWNPDAHPGHAAAALKVQEVYSGAERLL